MYYVIYDKYNSDIEKFNFSIEECEAVEDVRVFIRNKLDGLEGYSLKDFRVIRGREISLEMTQTDTISIYS